MQKTDVSPRVLAPIVIAVVMVILAFMTVTLTPNLHVADYPWHIILPLIFIIISVLLYLWIRRDIKAFAGFSAMISAFFLSIGCLMLLPNLHQLYVDKNAKEEVVVIATLSEIKDEQQIWTMDQSKFAPDSQFFINSLWKGYNPQLEVGKTYKVSARYHFYDYVFSDQAFHKAELYQVD